MKQKRNHQYTTLKMNIPKDLLDEFNQIAELKCYTTTEAVKEAMRRYIADEYPKRFAEAPSNSRFAEAMRQFIEYGKRPDVIARRRERQRYFKK